MRSSLDEAQLVLALSLAKGMGPVSFQKLLTIFGSAREIFSADRTRFLSEAAKCKLKREELHLESLLERADAEIKLCRKAGVSIISFGEASYPEVLRHLHDPPIVLYVRGELPTDDELSVAVVGSRAASVYGLRMAREISSGLAGAGVSIISGLALGIDGAAHEAALEAGGRTYAVLGGGIERLYPPSHKRLAERICHSGGLISEYPLLMAPKPAFFPVRNRLISAFARGVLVVEAKEKSGALITADQALEQGRDVFALPGNADAAKSSGTNRLIKEGAKLVTGTEDILQEYGIPAETRKRSDVRSDRDLGEDEKRILHLLEDGPLQIEEIAESLKSPLQKLGTLLSYLEIKGRIRSLPGKIFQRK